MNFQSLSSRVVLCLILCSAAAAVFMFWVHGWWHRTFLGLDLTKDRELIAVFHDHRQAFDKLQKMAAEDVRHGWYLGISEKDKISGSRWKQYRQLISEIHPCLKVTMDGYGDGMRFFFAEGGISAIGPGWGKGIEYVAGASETTGAVYGTRDVDGIEYPEWQGLISSNLDGARTFPANVYLRPIESKWFIFFQRTD